MSEINRLCEKLDLGNLRTESEEVTGGLMHKMFYVSTDKGEYAIKVLNPDIMKRAEALHNMIKSEMVSNALASIVPVIASKCFEGQHLIEFEDSYYMIFDWLDGTNVFAPNISEYHCEQVGRILGKIHATNIKVESMDKSFNSREKYEWNLLLEKAQKSNAECFSILQENMKDILQWDDRVVKGLQLVKQNQVISHRDLDAKNVMWKENNPYIIDWESAGYINPFQELIEVLNYWVSDSAGRYNRTMFDAMIQAYAENMNISNVTWDIILNCSFDGMLGWLEYSIKRASGIEGNSINDLQEGIQQTKGTICELKKYESQMEQLKDWINEYVNERYSV